MKLAIVYFSTDRKITVTLTYDDLLVALKESGLAPSALTEILVPSSQKQLLPLTVQLAHDLGIAHKTIKDHNRLQKKTAAALVLVPRTKDRKLGSHYFSVCKPISNMVHVLGSRSFVTNMLWVPEKAVDMELLNRLFDRRMYDENSCAKCPYLENRHDDDTCTPCASYKGRIVAYRRRIVGLTPFIGLPVGARADIKKVLHLDPDAYKTALDSRPEIRVKSPMTFKGKLHDYQEHAVTRLTATPASGILRSAPRTGKTIMSMALICRNGLKTIFMAAQEDWLKQAHKEATRFTNLVTKQRIGFCKRLEDFNKYDVCLATYQSFLSPKGKKMLEQIRHMFGMLIVDEVHMSAADKFSSVVNEFNCKWKFGLTAEVERKDQRHWLCFSIFGPVKVQTTVETLRPLLDLQPIDCTPPTAYKLWHYGMDWMARDGKRNRIILQQIIKDIDAGRHLVVPVVRVSHAKGLADAINRVRPGTAMAFHGKSDRDKILKLATSGDIKVVTGIRSITSTGINIPLWDTLYVVVPISNPPKQYQELTRIATPLEGKPTPIIRHFVSKWGAETGCLRTCMKVYRQHCSVSRMTENTYQQLTDRQSKFGTNGRPRNPFVLDQGIGTGND
jgi:superfamily II DNA or RNA helicase